MSESTTHDGYLYWLCANVECPGYLSPRSTAVVRTPAPQSGEWSDYGTCPRCGARSRGLGMAFPVADSPGLVIAAQHAKHQRSLATIYQQQADAIAATEADS